MAHRCVRVGLGNPEVLWRVLGVRGSVVMVCDSVSKYGVFNVQVPLRVRAGLGLSSFFVCAVLADNEDCKRVR
ncbi:hypothetical protein ASY01nite_08460 [Acetobacter syzygii]|nr:hypothetical protein Absy_009_159 [Acetobacter syzygii]GEL55780.1 hypothetical protein ASY01nite_08460 [Acetobacter syzygii]